jgi:ferric-dicitrate binding protein FerR (iron transport regulator)
MRYVIFPAILILTFLYGCKQNLELTPQKAILSFIIGEVLIDGQPATLNQEIKSQMTISTGEKSRAEVRIGTGSGIQVRENSNVKLVTEQSQWTTEVTEGAVLNLFRPGSRYQLRSPAGVIAIRGTIFYVHHYPDGSQYVCTCNGTTGISTEGNELREVSAFHHQPYMLIPAETVTQIQPAEMQEHNDVEIFEFMYRIEREPQN